MDVATRVRTIVETLLETTDLSKLTKKVVRKHVRERLGDRCPPEDQLKPMVASSVDEIMSAKAKDVADTDGDAGGEDCANADASTGERASKLKNPDGVRVKSEHPNLAVMNATGAAREPSVKAKAHTIARVGAADEATTMDKREPRAPQRKRARLVRKVQDESSGDDFAAPHASYSDRETEDGAVSTDSPPQPQPEARRAPSGSSTTARASSTVKSSKRKSMPASDAKVKKLLRIARELGHPVPPSRLRCPADEKFEAGLSYLAERGIDNPLHMTRRAIAAEKEKVERAKELEGLDVANIIDEPEENGRPRRSRRAPVFARQASEGKDILADIGDDESSDEASAESAGEWDACGEESG